MKTIGIIGAMECEISALKEKMDVIVAKKIVGTDFYMGKMAGKNVALVKCGIGKVNAAVCTQALIDMYGVDYIINTGVAGAISKELKIGDVVISEDLMQHDFDTTSVGDVLGVIPGIGTDSFKADPELIRIAKESGTNVLKDEHALYVGRIATGDQFIATKEQKQKIWSNFKAMCAEMEGGAIAQTCYLNKMPFVIVRAISDDADEKATISFEKFVTLAAKNSADIVEGMISVL